MDNDYKIYTISIEYYEMCVGSNIYIMVARAKSKEDAISLFKKELFENKMDFFNYLKKVMVISEGVDRNLVEKYFTKDIIDFFERRVFNHIKMEIMATA